MLEMVSFAALRMTRHDPGGGVATCHEAILTMDAGLAGPNVRRPR
jgi:hypothetical protein